MVVGDLWSRALNLGSNGSQLEADLRRITNSEHLDEAPKDILVSITQASHNAEDRYEIMSHLQGCLSESSGRRWRRIHGGLVLLETLLHRGSPMVMQEVAEGRHFDPVQRLTFLERWEYSEDRRVQSIVRQKASRLRTELLEMLEAGAGGGGGKQNGGATAASSSASSAVRKAAPAAQDRTAKRSSVVNGIVSVGHRDDTSSDSDTGNSSDGQPRNGKSLRPGSYRNGSAPPAAHSSSQSSQVPAPAPAPGGAPAAQPPAAMNLLEEQPPEVAAETTTTMNLLDL